MFIFLRLPLYFMVSTLSRLFTFCQYFYTEFPQANWAHHLQQVALSLFASETFNSLFFSETADKKATVVLGNDKIG